MIPKGWGIKTLGELSVLITSGSRDWAQYYSDSGDIFIRMTNLRRDGINLKLNDLKYVNVKSKSSDGNRTSLNSGDVLISITAELGKIGWIPADLGVAYINQHTALIRVNSEKSDSRFIAYLLSSTKMNQKINSLNDAGAKAGLNLSTLKNFPTPTPPLPEQHKIASILTTWDEAINNTEQLLANSQQRKKALMQQLLTGKVRFAEFDGEWAGISLSDLCTIKTGKKDVNEGNPKGQYPFFTCAQEPTFSDSYSFDTEAILIAGNGVVGTTHHFKGKFEAYQRTYVLYEFKNVHVDFLKYYINYFLNTEIEREKQHGAMPYIKIGLLLDFTVSLPSTFIEQKKIANTITTADEEIDNIRTQLDRLRLEKKALMQQLLTGKVRVKVEEVA